MDSLIGFYDIIFNVLFWSAIGTLLFVPALLLVMRYTAPDYRRLAEREKKKDN